MDGYVSIMICKHSPTAQRNSASFPSHSDFCAVIKHRRIRKPTRTHMNVSSAACCVTSEAHSRAHGPVCMIWRDMNSENLGLDLAD